MKTLTLSLLLFVGSLLLNSQAYSQNFGGEIKLKITYEGAPVVGYTITGSINGHDIGGKGVTDSNGDVTLNSDPLPIPNIDVKGVKQCGNATYEWEASGFVYVSPTTNDNFYHLKLDKVAERMHEMSGLPMAMIMETYGLKCMSGSASSSSETTSSLSSDLDTDGDDDDDDEKEEEGSSSTTTTTNVKVEIDPREAMENRRDMLINQMVRIEDKIRKNEEKAADEKTSPADQNDALYKIKELEIDRQTKKLQIEETDKKLASPNLSLSSEDRIYYKTEMRKLKDEEKQLKEDKKNGVSLVEGAEAEDLLELSQAEIQNMSTFELKKTKLSYNSKIKQKRLKLKTQSAVMKQDKITQIENEIAVMENTILLIDAELEARGK